MSEFFSVLFDWFVIAICAFSFMLGCMSVVYMLLNWS